LGFASTLDGDDFLALLALRVVGIVNSAGACHNQPLTYWRWALRSTAVGKNVLRAADQFRGRYDSGYNYSLSELPSIQTGDRPQ